MITQDNAKEIAAKFGRGMDSECQIVNGGSHKIASVFFRGIFAFQFGIRHDKKAPHHYIPHQMGLSELQAIEFAKCNLSVEDWIPFARSRDLIPPEPPLVNDGVFENGAIVNIEEGPENATITYRNEKANTYGCSWISESGFQLDEFPANKISLS